MKKILLFTLILLSSLSCKKDEFKELFTMRYEVNFTITSGMSTVETHKFRFPTIENKLQSFLNNNNISKSRIAKIEPGLATFTSVFEDFDRSRLQEVTVNIFDLDDSAILQEILFNNQIPIVSNTDELKLIGSLGQITPIVLEDPIFGVQVELNLRQVPIRSYECRVVFDLIAFEEL